MSIRDISLKFENYDESLIFPNNRALYFKAKILS